MAYVYIPPTDEINDLIGTHAALTASHGVAKIAEITSGTYSGNDTVNRAIPHGLTGIPKMVKLQVGAHAASFIIVTDSARIDLVHDTITAHYSVTAMDATNFYVGNVAQYTNSGNGNTETYKWVAFA